MDFEIIEGRNRVKRSAPAGDVDLEPLQGTRSPASTERLELSAIVLRNDQIGPRCDPIDIRQERLGCAGDVTCEDQERATRELQRRTEKTASGTARWCVLDRKEVGNPTVSAIGDNDLTDHGCQPSSCHPGEGSLTMGKQCLVPAHANGSSACEHDAHARRLNDHCLHAFDRLRTRAAWAIRQHVAYAFSLKQWAHLFVRNNGVMNENVTFAIVRCYETIAFG